MQQVYLESNDQLSLLQTNLKSRGDCVLRRLVRGNDFEQLHFVDGRKVVHSYHLHETTGKNHWDLTI